MRLLIVDYSKLSRMMLKAIVVDTLPDSEIIEASTGDEALAQISDELAIDMAIVDYNMPGMASLEGLDRIVAKNGGRPVGLMSGNVPFEIIEGAIARGVSGYLPKALEPKLIVKAVRQMADGHRFPPHHFMTRHFDA